VIAAIHNGCVGAGVDMITCTDIRLCTKDAWFQVKEVEAGRLLSISFICLGVL
jgi:delta(3,5)-delta(2,4)-dienoyl-CoA isomerase